MTNEMIFYLGVGSMVISFLFGIVYLIAARISWMRLEKKMDQEYGIYKR